MRPCPRFPPLEAEVRSVDSLPPTTHTSPIHVQGPGEGTGFAGFPSAGHPGSGAVILIRAAMPARRPRDLVPSLGCPGGQCCPVPGAGPGPAAPSSPEGSGFHTGVRAGSSCGRGPPPLPGQQTGVLHSYGFTLPQPLSACSGRDT